MSATFALARVTAFFGRSVRCMRQLRCVTSDAADLMMFRRVAALPTVESDTWRAAWGLCLVFSTLELHSGGMAPGLPWLVALPCSAVMLTFAWRWALASSHDARKAYVVLSAGGFAQCLAVVAPRFELAFCAWFVAALLVAVRRLKQ